MSDMPVTSVSAVIRVTSGPDAGRTLDVRDEMIHLGRGDENDLTLTDPDLVEHEVSIVLRNGRFAIYAAREDFVGIDGSLLPSQRWVWMPERALVQLGSSTEFEFQCVSESRDATAEHETQSPPDIPSKSPPAPPQRGEKKASRKPGGQRPAAPRKKSVARFITDQVGDPLVKLGEDGHLPELSLVEPGERGKTKDRKAPAQSNSLLVYGAIGFSFLFSLMLLFLDPQLRTSSESERHRARQEIQKFYGRGQELKPYQILLREAQLAHSRQDLNTEEMYYRRVLKMLTAEDNQGLIRLTETPEHDRELRELLSTLLAK